MRPEGWVVLGIGVALFLLAVKGGWQKVFPFMVSTSSGPCPPGYMPQSVAVLSGITGTNYCMQASQVVPPDTSAQNNYGYPPTTAANVPGNPNTKVPNPVASVQCPPGKTYYMGACR
jgi:hypothetical protein